MDLEIAGPTPDAPAADVLDRRSLIARVGAAGLAGLAAAVIADGTALASSSGRPDLPTAADIGVLREVIGLETAANELYRARLDAGVSDALEDLVGVMAENHQAYAQAVAGTTGLSAQESDSTAFVEAFIDRFTGSTDDFLAAAHELEQTAVATHTALVGDYDSVDAIALGSSIAVVEARHATVLADLLGVDDLDTVLGNSQSALTLSGDDA